MWKTFSWYDIIIQLTTHWNWMNANHLITEHTIAEQRKHSVLGNEHLCRTGQDMYISLPFICYKIINIYFVCKSDITLQLSWLPYDMSSFLIVCSYQQCRQNWHHGDPQFIVNLPDSKVHRANMGPTWVLSAPDGPHVGPMNLAIRTIAADL